MMRAALEHINQGVATFDAAARLVGWNRRFVLLLELPLPLLHPGTHFNAIEAHIARFADFGEGASRAALKSWLVGKERRQPLSFEMRHENGMMLDCFVQEMPDRGFVLSLNDVTRERMAIHSMLRSNATLEARVTARTEELANALDIAERANATRVRFVAAASHDLLQPLSAAKLYVAAARDDTSGSTQGETLDKAYNALISVEGILGALLDISRLETGGSELDIATVPMSRLLAQLAEEFVPVAAQKGLRLDILPCAASVRSDPVYLRRILQNLISNAIRYTDSGRVLVGARRRGDTIRLEVRDTGPGIAPEDQAMIFREFHRVNRASSASDGIGLGLAIVDRACRLLNHPLTLNSVPGQGTCFAVELPVVAAHPGLAMVANGAADRFEATGIAGDRIAMLVENDEELRRAFALLLEGRGIDVLEAANGAEAQALLKEIGIAPDYYLIDQQLGEGMTGVETAEALHAAHGVRPTRIITADRSAETLRAVAAAGLEIMFKPLDIKALEDFLRQEQAG
ncbi:hybrid sensor histidine kinase/response regulator [Paracoccus caeni]|nr:ATP-binding protein [Paracoccus caeni]